MGIAFGCWILVAFFGSSNGARSLSRFFHSFLSMTSKEHFKRKEFWRTVHFLMTSSALDHPRAFARMGKVVFLSMIILRRFVDRMMDAFYGATEQVCFYLRMNLVYFEIFFSYISLLSASISKF